MNLNEFLQPIGSPITRYTGDNSYLFNSETQRGSFVSERLFGQAVIPSLAIKDLEASKLTAGDILVAINVGTSNTGYQRIDGVNNRFVTNDGTTNRIAIGNI